VPVGVWSPKVAQTLGKSAKPAPTAKEMLSAKAKAAQASTQKAKTAATAAPADGSAGAEAAAPADNAGGIDAALVSAGWDDAVEAIRSAGDGKSQALIDAWIGASNGAAIAAVAEAEGAPSSARKAARRALNVLKSRGVAVPSKPVVVRFTEREELVEATFIPPDSSGTSALSVTSRDTSGRYHLAEVVMREPFGILQAGTAWLSGSQLKEGRTRALDNLGTAPVPVPVEWARYRIAEARKQNATSRQVMPLGFDRCKELVEPAPETEPAHPVADLEAEITSELAWARAPGSAALHDEPEFRSWMPDRKALDEMLQGLGKRLGADGARDAALVNTALQEEVALAADRFFSPEIRGVLAKRMRDSAISVRARKGDARATEVLAVARAVKEAGLITSPPREIPFLIAFFQKALGALAQQGGGSLRVPIAAGMQGGGELGGEGEQAEAGEQTGTGEQAGSAEGHAGAESGGA
jgi:hypothetical protein